MIDKEDELSVTRQCEILDLSRSGIYYMPVPLSARDMELMRQIDEIHLMYPFYGSRKIRNELWAKGYDIGRDRVRRLMRLLVAAERSQKWRCCPLVFRRLDKGIPCRRFFKERMIPFPLIRGYSTMM